MVKRAKRKVTTDIPKSKPADVVMVGADTEELVPEQAPNSPPAEGRPVRVYADGEQLCCQGRGLAVPLQGRLCRDSAAVPSRPN